MKDLGNPLRLLVDSRTPERYRGINETLDPVGGHIPGAANYFFQQNLTADKTFKARTTSRPSGRPIIKGHDPKDVVVYCGSGVTACHNLLALEHAGIQGVKIFPDPGANGARTPSVRGRPSPRSVATSSQRTGPQALDANVRVAIPVQPAMKTMTLRILFTLAILVGLAAAPGRADLPLGGQQRSYDVGERAERALEQAAAQHRAPVAQRRAPVGTAAAQRRARRRTGATQRRAARRRHRAPGSRSRAAARSRSEIRVISLLHRAVRRGPAPSATPRCRSAATPIRAATYNDRDDDYYEHCEVRESTMPAGPLNVDAGQNGGVSSRAGIATRFASAPSCRLGASDARAREHSPARCRCRPAAAASTATGPGPRPPRVVVGQLPHQRAAQERSRSPRHQRRHHHRRRHRQHALRHHQRRRASCRTSAAASTARRATAASTCS